MADKKTAAEWLVFNQSLLADRLSGLSYASIAIKHSIPIDEVRVRIYQGIKRCRAMIRLGTYSVGHIYYGFSDEFIKWSKLKPPRITPRQVEVVKARYK